MEDHVKRDLIWAILFFVAVFIIWLTFGGPSREPKEKGLFFGSPVDKISEEIKAPINQSGGSSGGYAGKDSMYLSAGIETKENEPKKEFISIQTSFSNKNSVDISDWSLEGKNGERIKIGKAALVPFLGQDNALDDILLAPGEKAVISSGESPIGVSFKLNKCAGYFNQLQTFIPPIYGSCPDPIKDEVLPATLDNSCIDYINNNFKNCTEYITLPSSFTDACRQYANDRLNYNACANRHKRDSDFYKPEWRIYLNKKYNLWNNEHDKIILYDQNNNIIDSRSY